MRTRSKKRSRLAIAMLVASAALATTAVASALTTRIVFGDGTYRVGKDIKAGTYRSRGGDGCYWARLSSFSGSFNAILANENAAGPTIVTILKSDKGFTTERCGSWTSNLKRITKSKTRFGQGTFIVRTDIAPGTYRTRGGGGCYWARLSSFTGSTSAIIANDNPSGSAIVTISPGDKGFTSERCGTWARS